MLSILIINKNNENKIFDYYPKNFRENTENNALFMKEKKIENKSYTVFLSEDKEKKTNTENNTDTNKKNGQVNSKNPHHPVYQKNLERPTYPIHEVSPEDPNDQNEINEKKQEKAIPEENSIKKFIFHIISNIISVCVKFFKIFIS